MNILFFNRSFYPDTEATGQYLTELCEDLSRQGHHITVVCGRSYYVSNETDFFLIRKEKHGSINIVRANGTTLPKSFLFLRLINLGTYFLLAFLAGFLVKEKPDVVIAQTDPPVLGLLGLFFSKKYKAKFVYSCKDIYPEVGIITGRLTNPVLNYLLEKINVLSFKSSDKVLCLGEDMKNEIKGKGVDEKKIIVIHDWADTDDLYPINEDENLFLIKNSLKDKFIIMYSGNIGLAQGLDNLIEVAVELKHNSNLMFLLIGEGANKKVLQQRVKNLRLKNIMFLPYQPKSELRFSLSAPNIHLITLQGGLKGVMVPSKVYGIMACGKPFLACVDRESEIHTIAKRFNCGLTVLSGDVENMVKALEWSMNHPDEIKQMGKNGRKAVLEYFDRKIGVANFNKVLEEVLS